MLRAVDKDRLATALKGANESAREFFFGNMSQRAAKMLLDDMEAMGPVRLSDVDEGASRHGRAKPRTWPPAAKS